MCSSPEAGALLNSSISTVINELYPLRIIGLNQDEKASGGMAGLTFCFKNMIEHTASTAAWNISATRTYLVSGDFWNKLSPAIQSSVKIVKKYSAIGDLGWGSSIDTIKTQDRVFLVSCREGSSRSSVATLFPTGGVGKNKDERYLVFSSGAATPEGIMPQGWARDFNNANNQIYTQSGSVNWLYPPSHPEYGVYPAFCF